MSAACKEDSCTVGETATCLLNNDPASCPNRIKGDTSLDVGVEIAPLQQPSKHARFPFSAALTPPQARELMGTRYCRLVGILGAPDAGKTAVLVSLYLLLAHDKLGGVHFADSRTLMAFDELSAGARRWHEGKIPAQMTAHTERPDEREPGYLHLRFKRDGKDPVDVLLPDLPGEWTTSLVDAQRVDRLQFLKGADLVWLMVDGHQLATSSKRQWALHRTKLLMKRLSELVVPAPPVILVISRRDKATIDKSTLDQLSAEATTIGLTMTIVQIASFADEGTVAPGTGIADLVLASLESPPSEPPFWQDGDGPAAGERAMLRFRVE